MDGQPPSPGEQAHGPRMCETMRDTGLAGAWESNSREQRGSYCEGFHRMLGFEPGELMERGVAWMDLVHPEDLARARLMFRNHALSNYAAPFHVELRLLRKGGGHLWVLCTGRMIERDEEGQLLRTAGTVIDISDRKRLEENLRGTLAALDRRNDELASYAHITAHDLRAPVTSLVSLLDLYREDPSEDVARFALNNMGVIVRDLLVALDTLGEVLNVRRRPDVVIEEVEVGPVLDRAVAEYSGLLGRCQGRVIRCFDGCPRVPCFPPYLDGILRGLLANAIHYRHPERPLVIKVSTEGYTKHCSIRFEDNGTGIDLARHGRRLFGMQQRFHRLEDEPRGTGLFVMKAQVDAMGGHVSVASELDGGSTFTVTLPRKQ